MAEQQTSTIDKVHAFIQGKDPMERIVSVECGWNDDKASIIYNGADGIKRIKKDGFKPFVFAKASVSRRMFGGDRKEIAAQLRKWNISCTGLITKLEDTKVVEDRLANGYTVLFQAKTPMSWKRFNMFFNEAGTPLRPRKKKGEEDKIDTQSKEFLSVTPVEQYLMYTGKRLFKDYEGYDNLKRLIFDLETTGLNGKVDTIDQIGMKTNKGFEEVFDVFGDTPKEKGANELMGIRRMLEVIKEQKPDVIVGHNSENFDWQFIIDRCICLGTTLEELSAEIIGIQITKAPNEAVLKLGGEMEKYRPTKMWGHNIIDSLHAVRRAQAIDSSMKSANLKYVTKYLELKKDNRVYVKGSEISTIWHEFDKVYAFNNDDGSYYKIDETHPLKERYEKVSGKYIVQRYLIDDLWETEKVELKLNEANFLVSKMLCTSFSRACTMGTAGIWKLIILAWCYEQKLAVPAFGESKRFTGGLSRLLKVGYAPNVVKLDYNSLYPSIILTWLIESNLDISHAMTSLLDYVLSQREKYKGLKKQAGKNAEKIKAILENFEGSDEERKKLEKQLQDFKAEESANDKKQLPLKILGNSMFGSFGAPNVFPMGDNIAAEKTTCIGRQCLRLMISHFKNLGYEPIVGDTDGFNFVMPNSYRYTEDNPYIGKGLNRDVKEGEKYTGLKADVMEFDDLYMRKKMGLGIDEIVPATINFARKNYADLLDEKEGKVKLVGNTVKSRKLSGYIEKFLDKAILMLLMGNGKGFLDEYYRMIDDIDNYRISIRDIASKGKIKKKISEYKADCNTLTKSGSKKSRQAWYELLINEDIEDMELNSEIYYLNIGKKKGDSDVKRITHQFTKYFGNGEVEMTNKIQTQILKELCEKEGLEYKTLKTQGKKDLYSKYNIISREEDEIKLACVHVPSEIVNAETEYYCADNPDYEYNVEKYIEQFNKRITPLLVCFKPEVRNQILVKHLDERPIFSDEDCQLDSGHPNKETDQDTYEQLMTMERKEIEYWDMVLKEDEEPPFVKECGQDWKTLRENFRKQKEEETKAAFQDLNNKYLDIINNLSDDDYENFLEEGELPSKVLNLCYLDNKTLTLKFKELNMTPTTGGYILTDFVKDELNEDISSETKFENLSDSLSAY